MNNEEDKQKPVKHNFDAMLDYFKRNPDKLEHYKNVMKKRYNVIIKKEQNDKTS